MELYILLAMFLLLGIAIGMVVANLRYVRLKVGTLRVDRSDPDEPPYLFLELNKNVGDITSKPYVVLKVSDKNYISRD